MENHHNCCQIDLTSYIYIYIYIYIFQIQMLGTLCVRIYNYFDMWYNSNTRMYNLLLMEQSGLSGPN